MVDISLIYLVVFIIAASAFGFVVNDISDRELDAKTPFPRNPLADGSMSLPAAILVSAILLLVTLVCMVLLPSKLLWIEILILFMFVTYSFLIETKNIAGLDLLYHAVLADALRYAWIPPVSSAGSDGYHLFFSPGTLWDHQ